jgi:hypothetical protein
MNVKAALVLTVLAAVLLMLLRALYFTVLLTGSPPTLDRFPHFVLIYDLPYFLWFTMPLVCSAYVHD